jgi:hypothetical protein
MNDLDLRIDFTDVEVNQGGDFTPVPPSKQNVVISDWDQGVTGENSKNPGSTKLTLEVTIQDGEYQGRRIWDVFTFGEKTLWKIKGLLTAIGEDTDRSWTVAEILDAAPDWVGKELVVRLAVQPARQDERSGTEYPARNQVKNYFPAANGSLAP